jgi:predicted transcriptional regulator
MVYLEDWVNIQEMRQIGMSQCQIAARLDLDRKTVRKYLHGPRSDYPTRSPRLSKVAPYRSYLRERWEKGVHNSHKLSGNSEVWISRRLHTGSLLAPNGNEPSCALRRHPARM